MQLSHVLNGKPVELDFAVQPEDRSVGIMGPGMEDLIVTDEDGKQIELTEAEENAIYEDDKLNEALRERYYEPDEPY